METFVELAMLATCLLMVAVVVAVFALGIHGNKRRQRECQHWCDHNGLAYLGEDETVRHLSRGYPFEFGILATGWPEFVMRGSHRGHHTVIFEWFLKFGKDSRRYEVIALSLPQPYPYLDITRRRRWWQYWSNSPGDSPAGRDFSTAFQLTVTQPGLEAQVRGSGIPALLSHSDRQDPSIFRVEGQWAMCLRPGNIDLPSVGRRLELLHRFVTALPKAGYTAPR